MLVLVPSRVLLLPTSNRRPTRRSFSRIPFDQIVSNSWVSPSQMNLARNRVAKGYVGPGRIVKIIGMIGWGRWVERGAAFDDRRTHQTHSLIDRDRVTRHCTMESRTPSRSLPTSSAR